MSNVIVAGGGAAGIMAAVSAAGAGHSVSIYEKNEKLGKKLYITGKGRCNLTNASDMRMVMENVISNPKFLYSAFRAFTNEDLMRMVEDAGCSLKVERGNRVFPVSDRSSDIIKTFEKLLKSCGVKIHLHSEIKKLITEDGVCRGIVLSSGEKIYSDALILATGGMSYQATGSTGDGYKLAGNCGHSITELYPSLVPFNIDDEGCRGLQGLSLKNIELKIFRGERELYRDFGELLFTHFGVSGPTVLSASAYLGAELKTPGLKLAIDLKPALDRDTLDTRVLRDFEEFKNKRLKNAMVKLIPLRLIDEVLRQSGIDGDAAVNSLKREERLALVDSIKALEYNIASTRGYKEAIITKGGVNVNEVNPRTMESKLVRGLYFAGEILDLDAYTGGYNLQIAWSTGYLAGGSIEYV